MLNFSKSLLVAVTVTAAVPVIAEARPSTQSYTCEGVKSLIRQRGAIVMSHKARHLYRRFVDSRYDCDTRSARTKPFSVPTKSGRCRLKICIDDRFRTR